MIPAIDDYDQNEEEQGGGAPGGGGGHAPGGGTGVVQAESSPQHEETFTPWSRFTAANQEVSNREAGKLQAGVQNDVNAATSGRDTASQAQQQGIASNYSHQAGFAPAAFGGGGGQTGFGRKTSSDAGAQGPLTDAALNAPQGSKDLETQLGPDAWSKLLGQTGKAGDEAHALGSETGVQGLVQERASQPLAQQGAFDAALESQAGAPGFQQLDKDYGKGQLFNQLATADTAAQGRWQKLLGDVDSAKQAKAADGQTEPGAAGATGDDTKTMGIEDILSGGGESAWSNLHQLGLSLSPADQADIELADATNTDLPLATEAFSSAEGGTIAGATGIKNSWDPARVRMAYDKVSHEFDSEAMADLRKALQQNPAMLKQYMSMKNPGYMAHQMRAWLLSAGHKQNGAQHNNQPQAQQFGGGQQGVSYTAPSGQQRTTTPQQESDRTYAYRQGWGEEWDRQFNGGNDNPTQQ